MPESVDLFSLTKGLALKREGMDLAAQGAEDWLTKARSVAEMLAVAHGETNAAQVLKHCPRPEWISPNSTGSIFRGKQWALLGYMPTDKISGRGRMIGRWTLK